jgi:chromosome segregation ATPase
MNTPLDFAKLADSNWHLNQLYLDFVSNPFILIEALVKDAKQQLLGVTDTTHEDEQKIGELEEEVDEFKAENKRLDTENDKLIEECSELRDKVEQLENELRDYQNRSE